MVGWCSVQIDGVFEGKMYTRMNARIEALEVRCLLSEVQIGPTPPDPRPYVNSAVNVNGGLLFSMGQNSGQSWFGDGTEKGTHLIQESDIPPYFTAAGGQAFFGGLERTDGTAKGTKLVKQFGGDVTNSVVAGGLLYFVAPGVEGDNKPLELWRSDGTAAGTIPLGIGLTPEGKGINGNSAPLLGAVGNKLYFLDNRPSGARFLGVSDGTVAGTHLIKNLPQDPYGPGLSSSFRILGIGNEAVIFAFAEGFNDPTTVTIWRSDGKAADTMLVFKSSYSGESFSDVTVMGSDLYIGIDGGMVRINPMKGPATQILPFAFSPTVAGTVAVGNTLYFVYASPTAGSDDEALFAIDSTSSTPRLVKDYAEADVTNYLGSLFNSGGQIYLERQQTAPNSSDAFFYTAINSDGTTKDVLAPNEETPQSNIPGFQSEPPPVTLPSAHELVVFSDGIHLLGPSGEMDHWNPGKPTGKLASTVHVAGGQSDIQFKLMFTDSFMSGLKMKPLQLIGPDGDVLQPKLLGLSGVGTSSLPEVARFHVIGPGGNWDASDVGTYRLVIPKDAITTDGGAFSPGVVGTLSLVPANGKTATIQGNVFQDDNSDGLQNKTEQGVKNFSIFLDANSDGKLDGGETSTESDADGNFTFSGLAGGDYRVGIVAQAGMIFSTANSVLLSAEPGLVTNATFGVHPGAELNGTIGAVEFSTSINLTALRVFDDVNQNGVLDNNEPSVPVKVGSFHFFGLSAGVHHIRLHVAAGTAVVPPVEIDVTITPGKKTQASFEIAPVVTVAGRCTFAGKPLAGARIFAESDNNRSLNAGEPSVVTDANGNYTMLVAAGSNILALSVKGLRPTLLTPRAAFDPQATQIMNFHYTSAPSLRLVGFQDFNGNGKKDANESITERTVRGNLGGEGYFVAHQSVFEPPAAGVYTLSHVTDVFGQPTTTIKKSIQITLTRGEEAVVYIGV
jgi:SdrD B-like domain